MKVSSAISDGDALSIPSKNNVIGSMAKELEVRFVKEKRESVLKISEGGLWGILELGVK